MHLATTTAPASTGRCIASAAFGTGARLDACRPAWQSCLRHHSRAFCNHHCRRDGKIFGLTMRVGRAIPGSADLAADVVRAGCSILLLGEDFCAVPLDVIHRAHQSGQTRSLGAICDARVISCRTTWCWQEWVVNLLWPLAALLHLWLSTTAILCSHIYICAHGATSARCQCIFGHEQAHRCETVRASWLKSAAGASSLWTPATRSAEMGTSRIPALPVPAACRSVRLNIGIGHMPFCISSCDSQLRQLLCRP